MNQEPFDPSGHLQPPLEPDPVIGATADPTAPGRTKRPRRLYLVVIAAVVLLALAIVAERIKAALSAG